MTRVLSKSAGCRVMVSGERPYWTDTGSVGQHTDSKHYAQQSLAADHFSTMTLFAGEQATMQVLPHKESA